MKKSLNLIDSLENYESTTSGKPDIIIKMAVSSVKNSSGEVYGAAIATLSFSKDEETSQYFPKEYQYSLDQDMKRDGLQWVRSIYRANKATQKKQHLDSIQSWYRNF